MVTSQDVCQDPRLVSRVRASYNQRMLQRANITPNSYAQTAIITDPEVLASPTQEVVPRTGKVKHQLKRENAAET